MKDQLKDLIQYTHGLGVIETLKITGTESETTISTVSEDKTLVVEGKFHSTIPEFEGTLGMPQLNKLKFYLGISEYNDEAKISMIRNSEGAPSEILFQNKTGDFSNHYRLMAKSVIEDKIKTVTFKGAKWDVEFEPEAISIARLKIQANGSDDDHFIAKTENNNLVLYFGDSGTHRGNFVFQTNVGGSLKRAWYWPAKVFSAIMDLPGTKTVRMSDSGATEITVDSGIAAYRYLLPAHSK